MKTLSKMTIALVGVAGLAMAAETAQAATIVANGTGSSAGSRFAGLAPAAVCAGSTTTPLFFQSTENPPKKTEWQCTLGGNLTIIRYSATASADGYLKQPNGATATAIYLITSGCPAGTPATIAGVSVLQSTCPSTTQTQSLVVHWGGADVKASSIHQSAFGNTQVPPADGHLSTTATVIVPFSIVVGANVRGRDPVSGTATPLLTLTEEEIRQIFAGNVTDWTQLGYTTSAGSTVIVTCQRTPGSGTLATLDETIMRTKFWAGGINPTASATNVNNAGSGDMSNCLQNNANSIGYLDSDSVASLVGGAYQIAIGGHPVNNGTLGTGKARLTDLRCGKYPYWADWNFVTRNTGVEVAPVSAVAGTNALITNLQAAMVTNNPLPDYWLSENDTFVFKVDDRGPFNWFDPSGNGELVVNVCKSAASVK
jgi:ABC-type phosphate transport system substrate-binding protein